MKSTVQRPMEQTVESTKSIPYRPLPPIQTVFAPPPPPKPKIEPLTEKQIENWRMHLLRVVGPIALMMNRDEIERIRNTVQEKFSPLAERIGGEPEQATSVPGVLDSSNASGLPKAKTPSPPPSSSQAPNQD